MGGLSAMSAIQPIPFGGAGGLSFDFDLAEIVFTASMAKRLSAGPFYTAPIVQGKLDGTGTPDVVSFPRGDLLANQTQVFYSNFDPYQGSFEYWWTPENARDATLEDEYIWYINASYWLRYEHDNGQLVFSAGGQTVADVFNSVSGTTYSIVCRFNANNKIDNTNHLCISVNDSHTFGATTQPTVAAPGATIYIGSDTDEYPANAILGGLTWHRRVITDGTYGTNVGGTDGDDEIAAIYAAGAGSDPCLITGSWDVVACIPTDSTEGALTTGTGNAWSQPHASSEIDVTFMEDGGLPGTPYAIEFDGTDDEVNFGSDVSLDDMPSGASITVEGHFRIDAAGLTFLIGKTNGSRTQGWLLYVTSADQLRVLIDCATTDAVTAVYASRFAHVDSFADGKWHHVAFVYDDTGDKTVYMAVDGGWPSSYDAQIAGVGAYVSDAALSLYTGEAGGGTTDFTGAHSWLHLNNARLYTPGTDFVAPRALTTDGNTIEAWDIAQGSGNLTASITSPANDGVPTGATWSSIWQVEGTPVVPQSVEFYRQNDGIDFGSPAALDDLPTGDMTIEFWARIPSDISTITRLLAKTNATNGYEIYVQTGLVRCLLNHATNDAIADCNIVHDNLWHYYAFDWEFATLTLRSFSDGILDETDTAVGAYQADAANNLLVNARAAIGSFDGAWGIGPIRIRDDRAYTGNSFVPPPRTDISSVWTLPDANTLLQAEMTDGAGATVTDSSATGANGTITFGADTKWHNTPDMAVDEPGARVYNNGYNVGSDAADDGITIIQAAVTAETDYVIRFVGSYGQSGRAWPEIYLYDNIGAAQIGATFALPRVSDVHTGANNSATLINANGAFTQQLVGWVCYNVTDGSSGTITAVSGDKTTITVTLAGGTDDDFDTNDVYVLRPPNSDPYCRHPFATESIFVFRTPAGCTSIDVKLRNAAGEGVLQIHQCEVYESLLDNGDHESLTGGNPDLITGWTNSGLDAGDTQASSGGGGVVHAGAEAMQWNTGASNEGMYLAGALAVVDSFYALGAWHYGDGEEEIGVGSWVAIRGLLQYSVSDVRIVPASVIAWTHAVGVWRCINANFWPALFAASTAVGNRYTDDYYMFTLDDVSLTITPASQANSLEGAGIRIDGYDLCTQPIPAGILTATNGSIKFEYTPRHDAADMLDFGVNGPAPHILQAEFDATRRIQLWWSAASVLSLGFNDGGGIHIGTWNPATAVTGTLYQYEIRWTAAWMRLYVDGVVEIEIATPINFTAIPNTMYWATTNVGDRQGDLVIS